MSARSWRASSGAPSAATAVVALIAAWAAAVGFQTLIADTSRGFHDFRLAATFDGLLTPNVR